jgi:transcriptional regulator
MYTPAAFRITDNELIERLVRENPFATLVTSGAAGIDATHIPLRLDPTDTNRLVGHVASANPICHNFDQPVLAIFHGPHAYVSPGWYEETPHVPTWNYLAVHATGVANIIESPERVIGELLHLSTTFEPDPDPANIDETFLLKKLPGLVCFEISVREWLAKGKLSQNQSEIKRQRVRAQLAASDEPMDRLVAAFME